MQADAYIMSLTGKSAAFLFGGINAPVQLYQDSAGNTSIQAWDVVRVGMAEPSPEDFAAALEAPTPVPLLAQQLVAAASATCSGILTAVTSDPVHGQAYTLAYDIVGPTATVPTADPAKTQFEGMAAANGFAPQAFANLVAQVGLAGLGLSTVQTTLQRAAAAAQSAADLATALTNFESSIAAFLASLNGLGLTITVAAPAPISIVGINA